MLSVIAYANNPMQGLMGQTGMQILLGLDELAET